MRLTKRAFAPLLIAALTLSACKGETKLTPEEIAKLSEDKVKEGLAKIASDQEDLAKADFEWVLEQDPENAGAHAGMAKVYLGKEDAAAALPHAEKAAAAAPEDAKAQATLGEALAKSGKHQEAAAAYAKAWAADPDDARWGLAQGMALLEVKDFAKAEEVLRKVGEEDDQIQYVWTALGDALRQQDKLDEALRMYMKGQNTHASDKSAFAGAAMVYEAKGDLDKAINQLAGYIQRDCCSNYSNEWAKPKLDELRAKNGEIAPEGGDAG